MTLNPSIDARVIRALAACGFLVALALLCPFLAWPFVVIGMIVGFFKARHAPPLLPNVKHDYTGTTALVFGMLGLAILPIWLQILGACILAPFIGKQITYMFFNR